MPRLRGAADGHARFSQPGDVARRASAGDPNALLLRAPFERIGRRPRDDGQQQGVQLADVAAQIVDAPALLVDALADERVGFPRFAAARSSMRLAFCRSIQHANAASRAATGARPSNVSMPAS